MYKLLIASLLSLFLLPNIATSQSIFTSLGGVKTNFEIRFNHERIEVVDQGVYPIISPFDIGDGVGSQQELYLQIMVNDEVTTKKPSLGFNNKKFVLTFYNKAGEIFMSSTVKEQKFSKNYYKGQYIYTINLSEFPLILLDHIQAIDIQHFRK